MPANLIAQQEIHIGTPLTVEGPSPSPPFVVVFEDDGETGYFYALDTSQADNPIVDALHIYNVKAVKDRSVLSQVQIVWSKDDKKAALLINKFPHAVFDFEARRGYCRTSFPPPVNGGWSHQGHAWNDSAISWLI